MENYRYVTNCYNIQKVGLFGLRQHHVYTLPSFVLYGTVLFIFYYHGVHFFFNSGDFTVLKRTACFLTTKEVYSNSAGTTFSFGTAVRSQPEILRKLHVYVWRARVLH